MNTAIDFSRPDTETDPTVLVDVPREGIHVVEDGDVHEVRRLRDQHSVCFCTNGRHSEAQHDPWGMHATETAADREARITGGHHVVRELFALVRVVTA